jgi:hypothetical protein
MAGAGPALGIERDLIATGYCLNACGLTLPSWSATPMAQAWAVLRCSCLHDLEKANLRAAFWSNWVDLLCDARVPQLR